MKNENKKNTSAASCEEAAERQAEMKTQGRKGCKMQRIILATTPENHAYVKAVSALNGESMSKTINRAIDRMRKEDTTYAELQRVQRHYKLQQKSLWEK